MHCNYHKYKYCVPSEINGILKCTVRLEFPDVTLYLLDPSITKLNVRHCNHVSVLYITFTDRFHVYYVLFIPPMPPEDYQE